MDDPERFTYDPSAARAAFERHVTFLGGFRRNVRRRSDAPAVLDPVRGIELSYGELAARAGRLAAGLAAGGVRRGDAVVFQLFNSPEFVLCHLAAQQLGAVSTPVNFRLSAGETAHVLDDSRPAAYVVDAALGAVASRALELADHRPGTVAAVPAAAGDPAGVAAGADVPGAVAFDTLLDGSAPAVADVPAGVGAWDESTRLYTSGTTGMPKGVPLPNVAEVMTAHDVIMQFPLGPQDRTLNMSPWFHRGGLYPGGPCPALYVGASMVTMRAFDADACLDLVAEHGLTFLVGAPTNLAMLADAQQARPRDLHTLAGITTMGAPLERRAALRYQQVLTPRIFNGYGTTESFWNTLLRPDDLPEHAGSAGSAALDDDVVVVRLDVDGPTPPGEPVARDGSEVGEVAFRTAKAGYAYLHQPVEEKERFRDGWIHSGDLATWDAREFVTIVGRRDDMVLSGGENVHPVQVEEVLNSHDGVRDSAVVGLPDDRWGQVVVAYVVASDPALTPAVLDRYAHGHEMLADYKRPRAYTFVDDLPRTATGKKMHYELRDRVAGDNESGALVWV